MKIEIKKYNVEDNYYNMVTSEKVFKPRRFKDNKGRWRFDENGIFSEWIFGKFGSCHCGKVKVPGSWCEDCRTRVIERNKMPEYYIPLNIRVPHMIADYSVFGKFCKIVEKIMNYNAFVYEGEVIDFDLQKIENISKYDESKVQIGLDALIALNIGATKEWYDENTIDKVIIPHPIFRPIISKENGGYFLGKLNNILVDLLKKNAQISSMEKYCNGAFSSCAIRKSLCENYIKFTENIIQLMTEGKKSVYNQEILSRTITGAMWAVITNNYDLDEDILLIGYEFAETLYPILYKKCGGDIEKLNKEIERRNYKVIVNRPPTIGQMSVIAMKPKFNLDPKYRFVISSNPIIYSGLSADTDGDRFFIIALYSKDANDRANDLLPSLSYINGCDGFIRNGIPEEFMFALNNMTNEESLKKINEISKGRDYESLERDEYLEIYKEIGENMWETCNIPTVGDIADALDGKENERFDKLTDFYNNREKMIEQINKLDSDYSDEESSEYIEEVMSSNSTDISESGVFYNMLMASADDIRIEAQDTDCGSEGVTFNVKDITEEIYNYKIKFSFVQELDDYSKYPYSEFKTLVSNFETINVRTPLSCRRAPDRCLCKKCAGVIKKSAHRYFTPRNFGIFTTLMITEHATQASLDSMNKGKSENINKLLNEPLKKNSKALEWKDIEDFINDKVEEIGYIGVQSRFYEVALLSRFFKNEKTQKFFGCSFKTSMQYQKDPFGLFVYKANKRNFIRMLKAGEFQANSIKTKICFYIYDSSGQI